MTELNFSSLARGREKQSLAKVELLADIINRFRNAVHNQPDLIRPTNG